MKKKKFGPLKRETIANLTLTEMGKTKVGADPIPCTTVMVPVDRPGGTMKIFLRKILVNVLTKRKNECIIIP